MESIVRNEFPLDIYMYAGKWYEIGRNPNKYQDPKTCARSTLSYYVDDSDLNNIMFDVESKCFTRVGKLTKVSKARGSYDGSNVLMIQWEKAPSPEPTIVYDTDYNEYSIEVMPEENGKMYYWILSRTPTLCQHKIKQLLDKMVQMGLDISEININDQAYRLCEKTHGRIAVR
jgi:lipocalin